MMMKKNMLLAVGLFLGAVSFAQKDPVLMTVDGKNVHQSEFLNIYTKNNPDPKYDKASLDEYMELFVNFKLKVTEAEELKMDTISKFQNELNGYREQLARPYLTDKEMNDELIKEAYYRKTNEVKASHILIQNVNAEVAVRQGASFGEAERKKVEEIKADIEAGKISFEDAAVKYSQDPSAKDNKGSLGYFSAFQMVYPFEEAAYTTKVGEISNPIKTRFGYHILKVHDKRPARGRIRVAHIYAKSPDNAKPEDAKKAKQKIEELYELLKKGKDFADLAKEHSEDKTSAQKGGELAWFTSGRMLPNFEEASFNLAKDGDYTKPIKTSYGWHIIKRLEYEDVRSFDKMEGELKAKIAKDPRSNKSKASFIEKLKDEYHYKDYSKKWLADYSKAYKAGMESGTPDVSSFDGKKAFKYSVKKGCFKPKTVVKVADFTKFMKAHPSQKEVDIKAKYNAFVSQELMQFERSRLEVKYPEYKALMQEYEDGILLFELTEQKVWKKASKDTVGLEAFYEKNKDRYQWKKRGDVEIYSAVKKDNIYKALEYVKDSNYNANQVLKKINATSQLNLSVESGKFEIAKKEELKGRTLTVGVTEPFVLNSKFVFIKTNEVLPPTTKKLDETRGMAISDYQTYLEKEWIKELKAKYPIVINEDVLYSLGK